MSAVNLPWSVIQHASTLGESEEAEVDTVIDGKNVRVRVSRQGGTLTAVFVDSVNENNDEEKEGADTDAGGKHQGDGEDTGDGKEDGEDVGKEEDGEDVGKEKEEGENVGEEKENVEESKNTLSDSQKTAALSQISKKKRGRPRKISIKTNEGDLDLEESAVTATEQTPGIKKSRGRPRKVYQTSDDRDTGDDDGVTRETEDEVVDDEGRKEPEVVKRPRGRPRKVHPVDKGGTKSADTSKSPKKSRGRPRKIVVDDLIGSDVDMSDDEKCVTSPVKRPRGRPRKSSQVKDRSVSPEDEVVLIHNDGVPEASPHKRRRRMTEKYRSLMDEMSNRQRKLSVGQSPPIKKAKQSGDGDEDEAMKAVKVEADLGGDGEVDAADAGRDAGWDGDDDEGKEISEIDVETVRVKTEQGEGQEEPGKSSEVTDIPSMKRKRGRPRTVNRGGVDGKTTEDGAVNIKRESEDVDFLNLAKPPRKVRKIRGPHKKPRNKLLENAYTITSEGEKVCVYCNKTLYKSNLWHHLYKWCAESPYRQARQYICRRCCQTFSERLDYQKHLSWHEEQVAAGLPNICTVCGQKQCKRKVASSQRRKTCRVCGAIFSDAEGLMEHQKEHAELYKFQCEFCGKSYLTKRDMDCHRDVKHLTPFLFNCVYCGLGMRDVADMESHVCQKTSGVASIKQLFTRRFAYHSSATDEEERVRPVVTPGPLSIEEIKSQLSGADKEAGEVDLLAAMCRGQGGQVSVAPAMNVFKLRTPEEAQSVMDPVFINKDSTLEILRQETGGVVKQPADSSTGPDDFVDKRHKCWFCGHRCLTAAGRYKHMKRKHGYKRYGVSREQGWCQICEKKFRSTYYLNHHIKSTHLGDKEYECDICSKRFKMIKDREYHKKTVHEGQYRYHCEKCGRGVHSKARAKTHHCNWGSATKMKLEQRRLAQLRRALEDGDKEYQCEVCLKRFKTNIDRDYHKKTVHDRVYRHHCKNCGKGTHTKERAMNHRCNWGAGAKLKADKHQPEKPGEKKDDHIYYTAKVNAEHDGSEVECQDDEGKEEGKDEVDYTAIELDMSEAVLVQNEEQGKVQFMVAYFDESGSLVVTPTKVEQGAEDGVMEFEADGEVDYCEVANVVESATVEYSEGSEIVQAGAVESSESTNAVESRSEFVEGTTVVEGVPAEYSNTIAEGGQVVYPEGTTIIMTDPGEYSDGTTVVQGGSVEYDQGTTIIMSESGEYSEGTNVIHGGPVVYSEGTTVVDGGPVEYSEGTTIVVNEPGEYSEDGAVVEGGGSVEYPEGVTVIEYEQNPGVVYRVQNTDQVITDQVITDQVISDQVLPAGLARAIQATQQSTLHDE